jgi:hypothetical protein
MQSNVANKLGKSNSPMICESLECLKCSAVWSRKRIQEKPVLTCWADPRVDSDLDGSRNLGAVSGTSTTGHTHGTTGHTHGTLGLTGNTAGTHTGTTGGISHSTNAGPHNSNLANKAGKSNLPMKYEFLSTFQEPRCLFRVFLETC